MANTYALISSVTVGSGGAATMAFSSIPSTYTDLVLLVSARTDESGENWSQSNITFNGSSSGYTNRYLLGTGSASSQGSVGTTFVYGGRGTGAAATASTFGNSFVYIPNYAGSSNKSVSTDDVTENNATSALTFLSAGLWSDSAAINSITITASGCNFVQYSTAYLYGISNA
jgi:hypothetical protein